MVARLALRADATEAAERRQREVDKEGGGEVRALGSSCCLWTSNGGGRRGSKEPRQSNDNSAQQDLRLGALDFDTARPFDYNQDFHSLPVWHHHSRGGRAACSAPAQDVCGLARRVCPGRWDAFDREIGEGEHFNCGAPGNRFSK